MNNENQSKDNKVDELAEALTEVVNGESEREPVEVEIHPEETKQEEPKQEELETDIEQKKSHKGWKITAIVLASIFVVVAGIYVGISMQYKDCFLMGTEVNGIDCSGMTVEKVGHLLQNRVEQYELTIIKKDGTTEVIKGTDIGIVYNGYNQLEEAFENQNAYMWPKMMFETTEITAEVDFNYDSAKLNEQIAALECVKPENQVAAVAATVVYKDGAFVIQHEVHGTQIQMENLTAAIVAAVSAIETTVNLDEAGCYIQPRFTKDSEEVIAARDAMNQYLKTNITYSYDNITVNLDKSQIYQWISVDENMTPAIADEGVRAFIKKLGNQYNTPNRGGQITTPTGKVANVGLAGYGRSIGTEEQVKQITDDIRAGRTVTREPIFSQQATPEGQNIWGATYLEVDITEQHMWYIVNGAVAFETQVVTGKKGVNDTPTGTFTILEKVRNKTLRGRPLANGKPSYLTFVNYWMRVTWSGIGFHDAGWQPNFEPTRYLTNGSHGCINMPPAKAAELYAALGVGTPVVIHY